MRPLPHLLLALALILVGNLLAWGIQTGGGRIAVQDLRWTGPDGHVLSALLYVPPGATAQDPAPGILAIHGYINSRETQDGFAIELARRGFVVLALDQPGHGYSDPPAFRNGFGGPEGLAWLRSLEMVDPENIGMEGHSMGGWAVLIAAGQAPDDYRSIVIQGSSTGSSGAPEGTPDSPRNLAVVFSSFDEFSGMMWGSPVAAEVPSGEKLRALFGTGEAVVPGRPYGSMEEGTARIFHQPPVTHPGNHISRAAIGHAVDWFQQTLEGEANPLPPADQIWYWKVLGNLVALVGMVVLLFATGRLLVQTPFFADLARAPAPSRGATGAGWWVAALLFVALPAVTLFPFKDLGGAVPVSALFPQGVTNQLMVWALLVGAISGAGFVAWHLASGRRAGGTADHYGLTWDGRTPGSKLARSFLLALLVAGAGYLTLALSGWLFTVDYRVWVFAIKPLSGLQARIALSYLLPFILFFAVYGLVLFGQLRGDRAPAPDEGRGGWRGAGRVVALSTLGFAALIAWQYQPLLTGGTLRIPGEALWSIIAFQFLPLMTIVGLVTFWFQRWTGGIWAGAFLSGLLVTWIVVASQATHYGF